MMVKAVGGPNEKPRFPEMGRAPEVQFGPRGGCVQMSSAVLLDRVNSDASLGAGSNLSSGETR